LIVEGVESFSSLPSSLYFLPVSNRLEGGRVGRVGRRKRKRVLYRGADLTVVLTVGFRKREKCRSTGVLWCYLEHYQVSDGGRLGEIYRGKGSGPTSFFCV
jgi:hypothetical protein